MEEWFCEWAPFNANIWVRPNSGSGPFTLSVAIRVVQSWPESLTLNNSAPARTDPLLCRVMNNRTRQFILVKPLGLG